MGIRSGLSLRMLYRVIMYIPNKIASLLSIAFGFIGKVAKILLIVVGSILALGAIIIFVSGRGGNLVGVILAILSVTCFLGQKIFAVLQQGVFTLKNWFSSKM